MSLPRSSSSFCTALTSEALRTKEWAMKSMSSSMARLMLVMSLPVSAGRSMCTPGTLTLLREPNSPSFFTCAITAGPLTPMTSMSRAPSSNSMWLPTFTSCAKLGYDTFTMSCSLSTSGRPNIFTTSPVLYSMGLSHEVVRISGPLVSIRIPMWCDTFLVFLIISLIPSAEACAVFILTTLTPA